MKKIILLSLLSVAMCTHADNSSLKKRFWGVGEFFGDLFGFFTENNSLSSSDMAKEFIRDVYPVQPPYQEVCVQEDSALSPEEKTFFKNRMNNVQEVLRNEFGIDKPLRLAFCCSGGGNRAMIGTLGFLMGAAKSKLLDSALYISALSGSTWSVVPFSYLAATTYKYESFESILSDLRQSYINRLDDYSMISINGIYSPPLLSFDSTDDVLVETAKRFAYDQPMTLVNVFGALIGDYALDLMGCDRLTSFWSTIASEVQLGNIPLPLCASIFDTKEHAAQSGFEWFEMSPLQAGSSSLGYVPVQYLGSGFRDGVLDPHAICPEYPIDFYLGMYGSAFAATLQEIGSIQKRRGLSPTIFKDAGFDQMPKKHFLLENSIVQSFAKDLLNDILTRRNPLTFAHLPNYSEDLPSSTLYGSPTLGMFDAGIDMDLPVPTLIDRQERDLDVIILLDSHPGNATVLYDIADYCDRKRIPFPAIASSEQSLREKPMTILNDPRSLEYNKNIATYIYIPTNGFDISKPPYITFNFKYTECEIMELSDTLEQVFLSNVQEIKEVMKLVGEYRR